MAKKKKAEKPKPDTRPSFGKRVGRFLLKCVIIFFILTIGLTVVYRFVPVYLTPLMLIRLVEQVSEGEKLKLKHDWVPFDRISINMPNAVIASEDNLFLEHNGFDLKGIEQALRDNSKKKRIRGGSTISQQTAKNVFLYPSRTWLRKGLEVYFTVLIEFIWSKERIMEVYLNSIEMGDGIYGVQAAAQSYFDRDAERLTKSQAALIAVCLPNPRRFSPANPSNYISKRRRQILNLLPKLGKQRTFPIERELELSKQ